jgi:hypothetical protein
MGGTRRIRGGGRPPLNPLRLASLRPTARAGGQRDARAGQRGQDLAVAAAALPPAQSWTAAPGRTCPGRKPPFLTVKCPARPYAPYKTDLLWKTRRALNRPGQARRDVDPELGGPECGEAQRPGGGEHVLIRRGCRAGGASVIRDVVAMRITSCDMASQRKCVVILARNLVILPLCK